MASPERLLIAEDDPPLRLVALALGAPLDARMRAAMSRFFTDGADASVPRLQGLAREVGLTGEVVPVVALEGRLEAHVAGVHYLLVEGLAVTDEVLNAARDLRLIQKHGVDCRNIDLRAAARRGIPVATLTRWANSSVAEHTLLLLLAVWRRLLGAHVAATLPRPEGSPGESTYNWARLDGLRSLRGATLGLIGLGETGRQVARLAMPMSMRVLYTQRRRLEPALERELRAEFRPLDALLAESDVVSLHVPLVPETRHLIGPPQLKLMKPGAILVNTSRGGLVDETALVAALRDGRLGGAGLDVRAEEPPRETALGGLPTVVLTPHVGAGTGPDLLQDVCEVLANVARVRRGDPPAGLVTSAPA